MAIYQTTKRVIYFGRNKLHRKLAMKQSCFIGKFGNVSNIVETALLAVEYVIAIDDTANREKLKKEKRALIIGTLCF